MESLGFKLTISIHFPAEHTNYILIKIWILFTDDLITVTCLITWTVWFYSASDWRELVLDRILSGCSKNPIQWYPMLDQERKIFSDCGKLKL